MYGVFNYALKLPFSWLQITCVMGYSLFSYIPLSLLCFYKPLQWPALLASFGLSTAFALKAFVPTVAEKQPTNAVPALSAITASQLLFMLIVKFRFFWHS